MRKNKYDREFLETETGKKLYAMWRNIGRSGRCEEWDIFDVFCDWALKHGYDENVQLKRLDSRKRFSPDNCYFSKLKRQYVDGKIHNEQIERWNNTVNKIRKYYGMEPLGVNNGQSS